MPDRNEAPHSNTDQPHADAPATDPRREQPSQPDADHARPPRGYDDPLRRERNSGLLPSDADEGDLRQA